MPEPHSHQRCHAHALGNTRMSGNTIVAGMLHIDGLPDYRDFILGKAGINEMLVNFLVGRKQTRRFGHGGMQTGDHTEGLD